MQRKNIYFADKQSLQKGITGKSFEYSQLAGFFDLFEEKRNRVSIASLALFY